MKAGKSAIRPWMICQYNKNMLVDLPSSVGSKHIFLQKSICQGGSTSDPHDFTLGLCARLCWDCYCSQHSSSTQQNEEDQRSKRTQLRRAKERPLFFCLPVGGHSMITWILVLPFLTAYLPRRGQSLTRTWTKIGTTYPPQSVNVIFE